MKRRMEWTSLVAIVAVAGLAACGGGDAGEANGDMGADTMAATTTPAPAQTQQQAEGQPPEGATMAMVTQGDEIYHGKGQCFTCHGPDGKGTQLAPDQTDDNWIQFEKPVTWEKIQNIVKNGVPNPKEHPSAMPPMGGAQLSDDEIKAVSAYIYSLSHTGGATSGQPATGT